MELAELITICLANGLPIENEQANQLAHYVELLRQWNSKINLISRRDEDQIIQSHILHSLVLRMPTILDYDFTAKKVADLGSGGGLPGIPIKIVTSALQVALIDSIQKKIVACNDMIDELGLTGIRATWGRAEELSRASEHAHKYDAVVSRAVAPLDELARWSKGLLNSGGILFALKGGDLHEEIARTRKMGFVKNIEEKLLELSGFDEFDKDEKKLITVLF